MKLINNNYKRMQYFEISLTPEERKEVKNRKENLSPAAKKLRDIVKQSRLRTIQQEFNTIERTKNRRPRRLFY